MRLKTILTKLLRVDDYSNLVTNDLKEFLTDRQCEVVKLKKHGYKNIEIAKELRVCPATITKEMKLVKKAVIKYLREY